MTQTIDFLALDYEFLMHFQPTAEQRRQFAKSGIAMPDGSFYIRNQGDLSNAIRAVGRSAPTAGESDVVRRNAVRRHIIKRAGELRLSNMIPDTWNGDGTLKQSALTVEDIFRKMGSGGFVFQPFDTVDDFLEHYGVLGMKWGVRRSRNGSSHPASSHPSSPEAARARQLQGKVAKSGTASLSNKDLQTLISRMSLEKQYSNLNPNHISSGRKYVNEILHSSGKQIASAFVTTFATAGAAYLSKKYLK